MSGNGINEMETASVPDKGENEGGRAQMWAHLEPPINHTRSHELMSFAIATNVSETKPSFAECVKWLEENADASHHGRRCAAILVHLRAALPKTKP